MGIKKTHQNKSNGIEPPGEASDLSHVEHPIFCFRYLHRDYHIEKCTDSEKKQLIEQIVKISSMSWMQLQRLPKHGIGSEKISVSSIKASTPAAFTKEVKHLLAFRFDGKKPFVGFRDKNIFHVFYIDRDFTLYDHH